MREADEEKEEEKDDDDETTLMKLTVAQLKERLRSNGLEAEKGWKKKDFVASLLGGGGGGVERTALPMPSSAKTRKRTTTTKTTTTTTTKTRTKNSNVFPEEEEEEKEKDENAAERAMSFLDRLTAVLNSSKKKNSMHERSAGKTPTSKKMTNTASTRKRKISFGADTSPRTTPASSKRRRVTFEEESLFGMRRMRYTTAIGIVLGTAACVLGGHLASVAYLMDGVA